MDAVNTSPLYVWLAVTPTDWIRCVTFVQTIAGATVITYDQREYNGLRVRRLSNDCVICERR